uniref:Uncharacterized protein n=1 Tax=Oryzias sinensis TaxID=183150 RepID=A0A8C7YAC3_9TELE
MINSKKTNDKSNFTSTFPELTTLVLQDKVLIRKLQPIDRLPSCSIMVGEIPSLKSPKSNKRKHCCYETEGKKTGINILNMFVTNPEINDSEGWRQKSTYFLITVAL